MDLELGSTQLMFGDCLERMRELPDNSIDAIVCDPPYGLSFMGKNWDHGVPGVAYWLETLRVLKPGAYILSFGGQRTYHRLTCAIEDAGYEIRDCVMWVFGTGFPKSLNVSKAIDKAARVVPTTSAAKQWDGWGTALKPAYEPIVFARKSLVGTVVQNILEYGCGAINIDACRVGSSEKVQSAAGRIGFESERDDNYTKGQGRIYSDRGRWPANFIHDGSDEVLELFPQTKSGAIKPSHKRNTAGGNQITHGKMKGVNGPESEANSGSAARFFYCAKASRTERDAGLSGIPQSGGELTNRIEGSAGLNSPRAGAGRTSGGINNHPTVKPIVLMQYLCRLVTPPNGVILDPFMGSGSTGIAAKQEGFRFIGIENDSNYYGIAAGRIFAEGG